jgi:16S rRNA (guanine527-N7)-methyltransferase
VIEGHISAVRKLLSVRATAAGIAIDASVASALEVYYGLLSHWNKRINLTALPLEMPTEPAIDRLLIEPLVAAQELISMTETWVDLGSGGGSPAIPMKIARPQSSLTMVESKSRKAAFLREAVRELHLDAAAVVEARFDELDSRSELAETADLVTVRGVRPDEVVFRTASLLLKPNGRLALFSSAGNVAVEAPSPSAFSRSQVVPLFQTTSLRLYRHL